MVELFVVALMSALSLLLLLLPGAGTGTGTGTEGRQLRLRLLTGQEPDKDSSQGSQEEGESGLHVRQAGGQEVPPSKLGRDGGEPTS